MPKQVVQQRSMLMQNIWNPNMLHQRHTVLYCYRPYFQHNCSIYLISIYLVVSFIPDIFTLRSLLRLRWAISHTHTPTNNTQLLSYQPTMLCLIEMFWICTRITFVAHRGEYYPAELRRTIQLQWNLKKIIIIKQKTKKICKEKIIKSIK